MKENKDPNTTPRKARESKEREADRRENEESDVFEIGSTAPWLGLDNLLEMMGPTLWLQDVTEATSRLGNGM